MRICNVNNIIILQQLGGRNEKEQDLKNQRSPELFYHLRRTAQFKSWRIKRLIELERLSAEQNTTWKSLYRSKELSSPLLQDTGGSIPFDWEKNRKEKDHRTEILHPTTSGEEPQEMLSSRTAQTGYPSSKAISNWGNIGKAKIDYQTLSRHNPLRCKVNNRIK